MALGVPESVNVGAADRELVGVRDGEAPRERLALALSVVDTVREGVNEGVIGAEGVGSTYRQLSVTAPGDGPETSTYRYCGMFSES